MYIGPDTILPVTSAVAAIAGVAVMFWHRTVAMARGTFRAVGRLFARRPS